MPLGGQEDSGQRTTSALYSATFLCVTCSLLQGIWSRYDGGGDVWYAGRWHVWTPHTEVVRRGTQSSRSGGAIHTTPEYIY